MSKLTWKLLSARKIIGRNVGNEEAYFLMEAKGWVWHTPTQMWRKLEEIPHEKHEELEETDESQLAIADISQAEYFGLIMLECQFCHSDVLCTAMRCKALYNDNKLKDSIVHSGVCGNCGKNHESILTYEDAKKIGFVQMPNTTKNTTKNTFRKGKLH